MAKRTKLTLFDLDHTLLSGDSDVLWCDFLIAEGLLDAAEFAERNADMESRYKAGTVDAQVFANFYIGTLAGKSPSDWEPWRQRFFSGWITPRLPASALELVKAHQEVGDLVVLTTATNRFITELTARALGIAHLIATEAQVSAGVFTGQTQGQLNMQGGKVIRLKAWLAERHLQLENLDSTAYSDSINDLPLLLAVDHAVAVDPDAKLRAQASSRGWQLLLLAR